MLNFWGPKKDKKVINSSTKCLISVKIAIMTPHIIPLPLVNVWLIFDLQKYVNWLCVFSKVNPCFQKAQVFCMDLQPAADPYNVVCSVQPQTHTNTNLTGQLRESNLHTTLYGSAAGCRSIQKTCAFWKNGLTFQNDNGYIHGRRAAKCSFHYSHGEL